MHLKWGVTAFFEYRELRFRKNSAISYLNQLIFDGVRVENMDYRTFDVSCLVESFCFCTLILLHIFH